MSKKTNEIEENELNNPCALFKKIYSAFYMHLTGFCFDEVDNNEEVLTRITKEKIEKFRNEINNIIEKYKGIFFIDYFVKYTYECNDMVVVKFNTIGDGVPDSVSIFIGEKEINFSFYDFILKAFEQWPEDWKFVYETYENIFVKSN